MQNIDYVFDGVGNVMSYTNNCLENGNYSTTQNYEYDNLYQLTKAEGTTILNRYKTSVSDYTSCYEQNFAFDNLGNMTSKGSREWMLNGTKPSSDLNYSFDYNYAEGFVHRLKNVGNRYYEYDPNGNLIREYDSNGAGESEMLSKVQLLSSDDSDSAVYGTEGAWGFGIETSPVKTGINNFERTYTWDDKNRLVQTRDAFYTTNYVYNSNDERVAKYTDRSETLYFNNFWSWHTDPSNIYSQGQLSKHIYLGDTRIVTKVSQEVDNTIGGEKQRVFYYHTDHLGSASLVTDYRGNEYERLEYTPYGELWVDLGGYTEGTYIPFKFSAKEMDEETGLYYFGARYLDPKYSMWISADPALGEYLSGSDIGRGGIYNHFNFNIYHYANNNPVKYTDPTGAWVPDADGNLIAEPNDGIDSLAKFQNISYEDAKKQLLSQGYTITNDYLNLKVGDKVTLDNVYTRSIANSVNPDLTTEKYLAGELTNRDFYFASEDYNCWGSAIAGSQGKEIKKGVGIPTPEFFDYELSENYSSVSSSDAKFGKTVLRFADSKNVAQHGAVYYGTSNDGTVYVYTKNGWKLKPTVMKLSDLLQDIPSYGTVQGVNKNETGYYNLNTK